MHYLSKQEQLLAEIKRLLDEYTEEAMAAFEDAVDRITLGKDY